MDRRDLLKRAGMMAVAGAAAGAGTSRAAETDACGRVAESATFVLVQQLENVVLAGNSYGGVVIPGIADRIPDTIRSLVFLEPAHLTGAWTSVAKKTFVKAMPNEFPALMDAYLSVKDRPGWTTLEIEGPHVFPITMPEATAQILEDAI
jgi:pimeloyl-ACP methyl ester carboxylesterase